MFQPVVISSGIAGWQFLQATYDRQVESFNSSAELKRDTDYFEQEIGNIRTAEELVSDRRLLTVALGAFGLEDDINNTYFIQKMLEEGTTAEDSLANRFTDERYKDFSAAFGFGPTEIPGNLREPFASEIIEKFQAQRFEAAVGEQNESMRIALYAERSLNETVGEDVSDNAKWFSIMGQPPLRSLFETALGLPQDFGQADIDQQLSVFKDRASAIFGSDDPAIFLEDDVREDLINKYLARSQINEFSSLNSSASIALTLLQA